MSSLPPILVSSAECAFLVDVFMKSASESSKFSKINPENIGDKVLFLFSPSKSYMALLMLTIGFKCLFYPC